MRAKRSGGIETMDERFERLTGRQRDCLRLYDQRMSAKDIADALSISPGVVNEHLAGARRILGVSRSAEAARLLRMNETDELRYPLGTAAHRERTDAPAPRQGADQATGGRASVAEVSVAYDFESRSRGGVLRDMLGLLDRRRNDISPVERILLGLLCGFLAIAMVGAFITLQRALG